MLTRVDLHTHSLHSDGTLSPSALAEAAAGRGVGLLALTDHDTLAGCGEAQAACRERGIRFVAGVELTASWQEREVHVVGLALDPQDVVLRRHCEAVIGLRRARIEAMGARLTRAGLPGAQLAGEALAASAPTRTHLARALHAGQHCASVQAAFDRWLRRGRPGYAPAEWPALQPVVRRILDAGGLPVLAHPHRYRLGSGALRELVATFKAAGGVALEASLPGMSPAEADRIAGLACRFDLAASIGSDFHEPGLPWRPVGRWLKLPERLVSILTLLPPSDEC